MARPDVVIVGTGLTGAVFARLLADAGWRVLVVERRSHVGGNVHDHVHDSGIRVHTYGPHYFRTSSPAIWRFVNRFARFYPYEARVKTRVDGQCVNWPLGATFIRQWLGAECRGEPNDAPRNLEEAALTMMPRRVYECFVKEYNEKQWGVRPVDLSADLCKRFDIRSDDDPRLTPRAKYQGLPEEGYASMMTRMLSGLPTVLGCDYLAVREEFKPRRLTIYTGPIDDFYDCAFGKLAYRGQQRETTYLPDTEWHQSAAQVNSPQHADGPHIRTLEWKHLLLPEHAQRIRGTVITREVPYSPTTPGGYEYPFPDQANAARYQRYRDLAAQESKVLICGRLGEYRYYDMDQAIGRAMHLATQLLVGKHTEVPTASAPRTRRIPAPFAAAGAVRQAAGEA
jgi:UDP-galactopyranose mutase